MDGHRLTITACLTFAAAAIIGGECLAQGTSLFGNRGPTGGQASFGGTSSFGRAGTSGFGTSSNRSAFGGSAGFGSTSSFGGMQSGLGSTAGFGQAGGQVQGSMLGLGQDSFGQASGFGQALAPGGMVGRSNTGTFIGSGQAAQQAFQQLSNFGQFNRGSTGNLNQNQGGRNQSSEQRTVRPRQRVAFEHPSPAAAAVNAIVQTRIERLSTRRPDLAGVSFSLDGSGVARLSGTVPTTEAARLAEAFVRLEPGVGSVENELVVSAIGAN